jgi:hypothetical protein
VKTVNPTLNKPESSEVRKGDSDKQRLQAEIERLQEENKSLKVILHSYYYIVKFDILYTLE